MKRYSIYMQDEIREYIQRISEKQNTSFSNALTSIVKEHETLRNRVSELEAQAAEHKNLVTLYTQIKDNMIKLYKTVKDNCNKL